MNVAKLAAVFQLGGEDWEPAVVTMHVMAEASHDVIDDDTLYELGLSVYQWWIADGPYSQGNWMFGHHGASWFPEQVKLQGIEAQRIQPTVSDKIVVPGENHAGEATSDTFNPPWYPLGLRIEIRPEPPQCCQLISLRTTVDDRRGRGRLFLPGMRVEYYGIAGPIELELGTWSADMQAVGRIPEGQVNGLGEMAQNLAWYLRNTTDDEGEYVLAVYSRTHEEVHPVTHFLAQRWLRTQRPRAVAPGGWATFDLVPP